MTVWSSVNMVQTHYEKVIYKMRYCDTSHVAISCMIGVLQFSAYCKSWWGWALMWRGLRFRSGGLSPSYPPHFYHMSGWQSLCGRQCCFCIKFYALTRCDRAVWLSCRRTTCLKYLVLANMLMKSGINPFDSQEAKPYKNNPEILAMTNLVRWLE